LVSALLQAHDEEFGSLTEEDVVHNVYAFFLAGIGTTSDSLSTTGFMLAQHPQVQAKLREEVDTVEAAAASNVGSQSDCPEWDSLKGKDYVAAVITESLRLWPSIDGVPPRTLTKDAEIGGLKLLRGSQVWAYSPAVQRRVSVWGEDAAEFRPERFLEGASTGIRTTSTRNPMSPSPMPQGVSDAAFTAFGGGVRPCIGRALAMIEMKLTLMHLLRRFTLVEMEPESFEMCYSAPFIFPKRTLKFGLKPRRT